MPFDILLSAMNRIILHLLFLCFLPATFAAPTAEKQASKAAPSATSPLELSSAFLKLLDDKQRKAAVLTWDDPRRTKWHYIPMKQRKGLSLIDMNPAQRKAARELLRSCLSPVGYRKYTQAMKQEAVLRDIENNPQRRDPIKYYWTFFEEPGPDKTWGLSVEGHHTSANFTFKGKQITGATPLFYGSNPAIIGEKGSEHFPRGTEVLKQEAVLAFELIQSLSEAQKQKAIVAAESKRDMNEGFKAQTEIAEGEGIAGSDLDEKQQTTLRKLLMTYVKNLPEEFQVVCRKTIQADGMKAIQFGWYGKTDRRSPHSYQIFTPHFLVLYFNTQNGSDGVPVNHAHAILRTLGQDFGPFDPEK